MYTDDIFSIFRILPFGFRICVSPWITAEPTLKQFRYPISKKKRMRRKFAKDKANWKLVNQERIVINKVDKVIYLSKEALEKLRNELIKSNKKYESSRRR